MEGNHCIHVDGCFGCCPTNPIGLKVHFTVKDGLAMGEFVSTDHHVGPPGIVHGGIIGALLDEALSFLCRSIHPGYAFRTIREEIVFRKPARVGETLRVEAHIEKERSRTVIAFARVFVDSRTVAEAKGSLLKIKLTASTDGVDETHDS